MAEEDDKKLDDTSSGDVDEATQGDSTEKDDQSESNETGSEGSEEQSQAANADWWNPKQKRFTQFKGDTPKEYLDELEKAYANSYNEYKGVKEQLEKLRGEKLSAIANDAASGKTDESESQAKPQSLTDTWVNQEMKRRHVEQYNEFATKHPEVNDDDALFQKLDEETGRYMNYVLSTEKRVPDLKEALEFAWMRVGPSDDSSKDEKVASAVKNAGAASKSKTVSKDAKKSEFSDKQIEAARRIDPTLRDKSRAEIEEILAKYKQ